MTDIALTELFGSSATYNNTTGIFQCDLSELHAITISNNNHVLAFESDGTTPRATTVESTFQVAEYGEPSNILGLFLATALSYTLANPKLDGGTLNNDRNFTVQTFANSFGTDGNFEPDTSYKYWTCSTIIYYGGGTVSFLYDPSQD